MILWTFLFPGWVEIMFQCPFSGVVAFPRSSLRASEFVPESVEDLLYRKGEKGGHGVGRFRRELEEVPQEQRRPGPGAGRTGRTGRTVRRSCCLEFYMTHTLIRFNTHLKYTYIYLSVYLSVCLSLSIYLILSINKNKRINIYIYIFTI